MITGRLLVLVRHAWAGDRDRYDGDDRERPLDERGREQARRLPQHLERAVGAELAGAELVSSPLTRCVQTLEPLAAELATNVVLDERLAEVEVPLSSRDGWPDAAWYGARSAAAVAEVGDRGGPLIVCSHGEVLPALLAALAARDDAVALAVDLSAKALPKGAAWLVRPTSGEVVELPPPDAT